MTATFQISAFGDEIAEELDEQLETLQALDIGYLELRGAWGKNVLNFDQEDVEQTRQLCAKYDVAVSCIGSPVGKSPLLDPIEKKLDDLRHIFTIAAAVNTRLVRVFSFYPPTGQEPDLHLEAAIEQVARLTELAEQEGYTLVLENERHIIGDTPERCHAILSAIDSPALRLAWDSANFVQVGVVPPVARGWSLLAPYVAHVHIKDADAESGQVRAAGEGDGQIVDLLLALEEQGYQGFLALEPHLSFAGPAGGFSGPDGMGYAAKKLREVMAEVGRRAV